MSCQVYILPIGIGTENKVGTICWSADGRSGTRRTQTRAFTSWGSWCPPSLLCSLLGIGVPDSSTSIYVSRDPCTEETLAIWKELSKRRLSDWREFDRLGYVMHCTVDPMFFEESPSWRYTRMHLVLCLNIYDHRIQSTNDDRDYGNHRELEDIDILRIIPIQYLFTSIS